MDGSLDFPVAAAPAPGEVIAIAPGVLWLRMKLPFALGEALAHLHYLRGQGALERERGTDGVDRFVAAA